MELFHDRPKGESVKWAEGKMSDSLCNESWIINTGGKYLQHGLYCMTSLRVSIIIWLFEMMSPHGFPGFKCNAERARVELKKRWKSAITNQFLVKEGWRSFRLSFLKNLWGTQWKRTVNMVNHNLTTSEPTLILEAI